MKSILFNYGGDDLNKTVLKAQCFVLIAAILWGTTGTAQGLAPGPANPMIFGALRLGVGGIAVLIIAALKGTYKKGICVNKTMLFIASGCVAGFQILFFTGLPRTGIALGTCLTLGSTPIFSGIIEKCMGKKLNSSWVISSLLAIIGCILLFGGQGIKSYDLLGLFLTLSAGLSYTIYVYTSRELYTKTPRDLVNALIIPLSGFMLSPVLLQTELGWITSSRGLAAALYLGIITCALAYTLFAMGVEKVSAPTAVTLSLAEPLVATILGVLLFKEHISLLSLIGIALLFMGILWSAIQIDIKKLIQIQR